MAETERIKIRALVRLPAWMFGLWGAPVLLKGLYDLAWGEPEANLYSPEAWAFVTREQWARYAGFEALYGLACLGLAILLWKYAAKLPLTVRRPISRPEGLFQ